jgi:magnesium chelatase family protein
MLPRFTILGLGQKQVQECKQRVLSALRESGIRLPHTRLTVSLIPFDIPKSETVLDLAIAIALLQVFKFIPAVACVALGELGLHGEIRTPPGIYGYLGYYLGKNTNIWLPPIELPASILERFASQIRTVATLQELVERFQHGGSVPELKPLFTSPSITNPDDFPTHYSQGLLRVLEICLAGNHHTLLIGSPGLGKSHTRSVLNLLLPPLTPEESWERQQTLLAQTWCPESNRVVALDQTTTMAQFLGQTKKSGQICNLQNGVLFLDELPLFRPILLQSLRHVLEKKAVAGSLRAEWWPHFVTLATCNPCPCSYYGSQKCRCTPEQVKKYFQHISGPLWDRFDVCWRVGTQDVKPVTHTDWSDAQARIQRARVLQEKRARQSPGLPQFAGQYQWEHLTSCFGRTALFEEFFAQKVSWRKSIQQARLACTIADLQEEEVSQKHLELARFFQMEMG